MSEDRATYTGTGWGGRRPGAGRKPEAGQRRRKRAVNLTDAEYAELCRRAERAGCASVSEYIRKRLLERPE